MPYVLATDNVTDFFGDNYAVVFQHRCKRTTVGTIDTIVYRDTVHEEAVIESIANQRFD